MGYRGLDLGTGLGNFANLMAQGYKDRLEMEKYQGELMRNEEQRKLQNALLVQKAAEETGFGQDNPDYYRQLGGGFVAPPLGAIPLQEIQGPGQIERIIPDQNSIPENIDVPANPTPMPEFPSKRNIAMERRPGGVVALKTVTETNKQAPDLDVGQRYAQILAQQIAQQKQLYPQLFDERGMMHPLISKQAQDMAKQQLQFEIMASKLGGQSTTTTTRDQYVPPDKPPKTPGGNNRLADQLTSAINAKQKQIKDYISQVAGVKAIKGEKALTPEQAANVATMRSEIAMLEAERNKALGMGAAEAKPAGKKSFPTYEEWIKKHNAKDTPQNRAAYQKYTGG